MKTIIRVTFLMIMASLVFLACQKETSFEKGASNASVGSLQVDGSGNCMGAVVSGSYYKDTTLNSTHFADINVQVDTAGTFTVTSDTVNGYYFRATGTFTATGVQTVRLTGSGKPLASGTNIFTVSYNGTTCQFSVTVSNSPGTNAVFTVSCTAPVINGTYVAGTALTASNTVRLNVNVTTIGSWNISTAPAVNGITFNGSGSFTTTGAQTITLMGSGTPAAAGSFNFPVTAGGASCNFSVTVNNSPGTNAVFTVSCTAPVINGTYLAGTALTAANTITLNVNVTTIGSWNISTAPAVNGITFSGSGTFTTAGAQTITLNGSGTPAAGGNFNFPVTAGGATCNFSVSCTSLPDYFPRTVYSNWSYELDNDANDSFLMKVIPQTMTAGGNTYAIFMGTDDASTGFDTSGYYRRAGNDYIEWIDMGTYVGLDDPLWMDYTFLKDNLTVGGLWSSAQFSGPYTPPMGATFTVTLRWDFSILQQNATVTVNGTSYPNTIEVKQQLMQLVSGTWTPSAYFRCLYSRDKGLIKQDLYNSSNVLQSELDVRRLVIY